MMQTRTQLPSSPIADLGILDVDTPTLTLVKTLSDSQTALKPCGPGVPQYMEDVIVAQNQQTLAYHWLVFVKVRKDIKFKDLDIESCVKVAKTLGITPGAFASITKKNNLRNQIQDEHRGHPKNEGKICIIPDKLWYHWSKSATNKPAQQISAPREDILKSQSRVSDPVITEEDTGDNGDDLSQSDEQMDSASEQQEPLKTKDPSRISDTEYTQRATEFLTCMSKQNQTRPPSPKSAPHKKKPKAEPKQETTVPPLKTYLEWIEFCSVSLNSQEKINEFVEKELKKIEKIPLQEFKAKAEPLMLVALLFSGKYSGTMQWQSSMQNTLPPPSTKKTNRTQKKSK